MDWRERDYYLVKGWDSVNDLLREKPYKKIPTVKVSPPYRHFKRDDLYDWNKRLAEKWYLYREHDGYENKDKIKISFFEIMVSCRKEYSFLLESELEKEVKKSGEYFFGFCKLSKEMLGQ